MGELSSQREADRITANKYAPPGVLINADLQVLQFRGPTSGYLEPPTGKASFDLLKMASGGLMLPLRAAINRAKKSNKTVRTENVAIKRDGATRRVNVEVIPLRNSSERSFLVLFEDTARATRLSPNVVADDGAATRRKSKFKSRDEDSSRNAELERELAETRDYLQSLQEQHEAANEELQASNEEVQSANEELQSINEELETSKEELESTNEELTTVNEEMSNRNAELNRLNSDLVNLQNSTQLAIVTVGRDLTIGRFSPQAEKQFNLIAADIGRPIGGLRHNLDLDDLEGLIKEVVDTIRETEREVRDKHGRWYLLRVRPYLTLDNTLNGAVLALIDIDAIKQAERGMREAQEQAEAIVRTVPDPLVILDADLNVNAANDSFCRTFRTDATKVKGRPFFELDGGAWNDSTLRQRLEDIVQRNGFFNDLEIGPDFKSIGRRTLLLNARTLMDLSKKARQVLLGMRDITERQQAENALRASEERYRALFELGPIAVYSCDAAGVIQQFNRHAAELWGRSPMPGDTDERFCGSVRMIRLDGSVMAHQDCPMAEVLSGKIAEARNAEIIIEQPTGARVPVIVNIRPLKNERGEITGAINCFYDISARKQAESHRELLMAELDHRLKNTLATVQAIAMHTGRGAASLADFRKVFNDRLLALSQTHSLLRAGEWKGTTLLEIVSAELSPYSALEDGRFTIDGDEIWLGSTQALALGLALHELTTNAAKHGALSAPSGKIAIDWHVDAANMGRVLKFRWREAGGPTVATPKSRGFGTQLIERGLGDDLGADVALDFNPEGVRFTLSLPLEPNRE